ncbi:MAG: hypothetical protein SWO11_20120 [Thermodesulfobacteriota bacterium]|nr:hypothetical protein [Thermodesulfobacteriota bacterium]
MTFEDELKSLVFFHLEEHTSAQHLLQVLEEDDFARANIAAKEGIIMSSFTEAINTRGLEQFAYVFQKIQKNSSRTFPGNHLQIPNGKLLIIEKNKKKRPHKYKKIF